MSRIYGFLAARPVSAFINRVAVQPNGELQDRANYVSETPRSTHIPAARCIAQWVRCDHGLIIGLSGDATWRGRPLRGQGDGYEMSQMADSYRVSKWQLLDELDGSFALAVLDPDRSSAFLAIDRMGIERLTYAKFGEDLVFGSSAKSVHACDPEHGGIRNQALYDFLIFHMIPAPKTVYRNVSKLPPATALEIDGEKLTLRRYWTPTYNYIDRHDVEKTNVELHEKLAAAILSSGIDEPTGTFLSGGLDSSSITGKLVEVSGNPARTFTVGFGEEEYDELRFARIANERFACQSFEYSLEPDDVVMAIPVIAAAYDEPFGNSSAVPTYFCAKLAAENGISHLLAGDGGDELFAGNERYLRQRVFEIYHNIPDWLRRHFLDPLSSSISPESKVTPLRKFRSYVDQANIQLPERFEAWNLTFREGGEHMLDIEFAESIDKLGPVATMREVWHDSPSENLLEKMLWYDWHFTLAYNDLRKVGTMCDLAGVRVSFPLLHSSVVELSTRVPPEMKLSGRELRTFFKRAMAGFLPKEILTKTKHGFGLPFGLWLRSHQRLSELVYSHLTDLKKRRVINARFIDDLLEHHRSGHPSYYGYAIWDLVMLEAWMAAHVDVPRRRR